jgi:hypothetical protein
MTVAQGPLNRKGHLPTAKEITRQSLEYQKEPMTDADAQSTQVQEDVNDQIEAAQKQIEDAAK